MKPFLKIMFLISIFIFSTQSYSQNQKTTTAPLSYLFVQTADSAVLVPVNQGKGEYALTMKKVHPYVTYFTDRPNRITGMMPTAEFMKIWQKQGKDSFAKDAPNVDVQGMKLHYISENKSISFVAELMNPKVNPKTQDITYDVKVLGDHPNLAQSKAVTLHQVVLFLDNWCPGCCCG